MLIDVSSKRKEQAAELACSCLEEAPASLWWRIGGGAFLAMNGMVFSVALNGSDVTPQERFTLELTILFVTFPVFLLLSGEFLTATWRALKRRQLSIEMLFLIGIVSSLTASTLFFIRGKGNGYADVAAMLLVIYALGRQIGAYGKQRVLESWENWSPANRQAHRLNGETVSASTIQPGDVIRVFPGEMVPVDCRVITGSAYLHEASLTGESLASAKAPGDTVLAGSFPLDASFDAEATAPAGENQLDQVRALIESGLSRPGQEQLVAMRVLRWFVPLVVLVTVGTFFLHWRFMEWDQAAFIALSVAVISCPCALGFATPLAVWTAIARLREIGILASSGDAVERLADIDTVVFDKTGTLTLPDEYSVNWEVTSPWQHRIAELRFLLREAEEASRHPLAKTLAPIWDLPIRPTTALRQVRLVPGAGIEADFDDGQRLFAGTGTGNQLVVKVNGEQAAVITLIEKQVSGVSPAIQALETLGIQVILSTGDSAERANAIPIVTRHSRQSPAQKHALMQQLHAQGRKVLFAGDGLNDSAAMAWSHVSCAAQGSSDCVRDLSGLIFLHRDWSQLANAIAIARKTRHVVRWNIGFSLAYNALGIPAAASGLLHPVGSALIMMASSLTVIIYSMHLMDWEPNS